MSEQSAIWAAFDFPRHPLAREDGERLRGAFDAPPERWLRADSAEQLAGVIDEAQAAARAGAWVLGGCRYEAAAALDGALDVEPCEGPLAEFAVFERAPLPWPGAQAARRGLCSDWSDTQDEAIERAQIERVREWIRAGDCYQVNLTTRIEATLAAGVELFELFRALHAAQPGGFSLFLRSAEPGRAVASVSPELFFDWRPLQIDEQAQRAWLLAAQPMKGTAPRGRDRAEDEAAQAHLRTSQKERAENLMIVDLLRNDIGRVASLGTVRVPRLFELHALPTVWQMTSTVSALSRPGLRLSEVFAALFPCGSVTGAPKVRAMQIIRTLEPGPRGWYCGALGLLQPGGAACFNVPIRTVEQRGDALVYGVGSAITLDSEAAAETAEWRAKCRLLARARAPIEALETLRLEQGRWQRLDRHLARLQRSARHFGLKCPLAELRQALDAQAAARPQGAWRGRLRLAADGGFALELDALPETPAELWLALADAPIDTRGPGAEFLQHKTTRREAYEALLARKPAAAFDLLLWNEDGELTECSRGNLLLQIDGQWLTPRAQAGLLPGVLREELLAQGRIHEARLLKSDLQRAGQLAFINSLRGWCAARLLTPGAPSVARAPSTSRTPRAPGA